MPCSEKRGTVSVHPPSVSNFVNCPSLAIALRQFQVFEELHKLQE